MALIYIKITGGNAFSDTGNAGSAIYSINGTGNYYIKSSLLSSGTGNNITCLNISSYSGPGFYINTDLIYNYPSTQGFNNTIVIDTSSHINISTETIQGNTAGDGADANVLNISNSTNIIIAATNINGGNSGNSTTGAGGNSSFANINNSNNISFDIDQLNLGSGGSGTSGGNCNGLVINSSAYIFLSSQFITGGVGGNGTTGVGGDYSFANISNGDNISLDIDQLFLGSGGNGTSGGNCNGLVISNSVHVFLSSQVVNGGNGGNGTTGVGGDYTFANINNNSIAISLDINQLYLNNGGNGTSGGNCNGLVINSSVYIFLSSLLIYGSNGGNGTTGVGGDSTFAIINNSNTIILDINQLVLSSSGSGTSGGNCNGLVVSNSRSIFLSSQFTTSGGGGSGTTGIGGDYTFANISNSNIFLDIDQLSLGNGGSGTSGGNYNGLVVSNSGSIFLSSRLIRNGNGGNGTAGIGGDSTFANINTLGSIFFDIDQLSLGNGGSGTSGGNCNGLVISNSVAISLSSRFIYCGNGGNGSSGIGGDSTFANTNNSNNIFLDIDRLSLGNGGNGTSGGNCNGLVINSSAYIFLSSRLIHDGVGGNGTTGSTGYVLFVDSNTSNNIFVDGDLIDIIGTIINAISSSLYYMIETTQVPNFITGSNWFLELTCNEMTISNAFNTSTGSNKIIATINYLNINSSYATPLQLPQGSFDVNKYTYNSSVVASNYALQSLGGTIAVNINYFEIQSSDTYGIYSLGLTGTCNVNINTVTTYSPSTVLVGATGSPSACVIEFDSAYLSGPLAYLQNSNANIYGKYLETAYVSSNDPITNPGNAIYYYNGDGLYQTKNIITLDTVNFVSGQTPNYPVYLIQIDGTSTTQMNNIQCNINSVNSTRNDSSLLLMNSSNTSHQCNVAFGDFNSNSGSTVNLAPTFTILNTPIQSSYGFGLIITSNRISSAPGIVINGEPDCMLLFSGSITCAQATLISGDYIVNQPSYTGSTCAIIDYYNQNISVVPNTAYAKNFTGVINTPNNYSFYSNLPNGILQFYGYALSNSSPHNVTPAPASYIK